VHHFAVISPQHANIDLTQSQGLVEHRVEHRREVARRGVDDLQHLRGRGLLFKRFSKISLTLGEPTPQIDYQLLWIG